jgi:outer membrane protein TolC
MIKFSMIVVAGAIMAVAAGSHAQQRPARGQRTDRVVAALAPQSGGLTADRAAELAVAISPQVALQRAEIAASDARASRTLARYVPRITLSAGVSRVNASDIDFAGGGSLVGAANPGLLQVGPCPDGGGAQCVLDAAGQPVGAAGSIAFETPRTSYSVDARGSLSLTDLAFSMLPAVRAARGDEVAATLARDAEAARVGLEARIGYYDWLRTVGQVAVAEQALASAEARLEDARLGLAGGTLAPADVAQIEAVVASARLALANATSFEQLARANLTLLTGIAFDTIRVGEDLTASPPVAELGNARDLIKHGKRHRAEARALRETDRAAVDARRGARVDLFPSLEAVGSVTHANPNPQYFPPESAWNTSWSIGLSLSWGFDRFANARAQLRELAAARARLAAQRDALDRAIAVEVTVAYQELGRAVTAVELSRAEVEAARAAYEQRVELFQGGEATSTEITDAEVTLHSATLHSVEALVELRVAWARLRHAAALDAAPAAKGETP